MRIRVIPYRQGSKGARSLSQALSGKVLHLLGSNYKPASEDLIINWGNTEWKQPSSTIRVMNPPNLIRQASNKLLFFGLMKEAGHEDIIPPFWTRQEDIPDEAFPILCRTILAGHSGDGIIIAVNRHALVRASLFVKYINKKDEYRVHIGKGRVGGDCQVIAVQRKARRIETPTEQVNWKVRNHGNGFIYKRDGVNPPQAVLEVARTALEASGLDFGGVDVIWNEKKGRAYVLEINTAPGLEGQTVADYAAYFRAQT